MKLSPRKLGERFDKLKAFRLNWEHHWQDIADYFVPRKKTITQERTRGDRRNNTLLDNTGMMSNELLAGALHGLLTNPHRQFFELFTGDKAIDQNDEARLWLEDSADRMHTVINNSNFQTEVHEIYIDLGTFGTAVMFMQEDPGDIVHFRAQFIRDIYVSENNLGQIDELHRELKWTIKNLIQEFGYDQLPDDVKKISKTDPERRFRLIHAVYPDMDFEKEAKVTGKFVSQWAMPEFDHELRSGFFRDFPYAVTRWTKGSDEIYGRSPAMNALPEMKTLNKMVETTIKGAQKAVDPPVTVPDDGFVFPIRTRPGSINIKRAGTPDSIEPIFNDTRIDFGQAVLEENRQRVREAFFIDQLKLREGPQMTATEVQQRTEEAMRLMGPVLGRQQEEFLRPIVDRVFNIMLRRGMFLPVPEALSGRQLQVRYSSLVAKAQRLNEGSEILRAFEAMAPFIQLDPAAADNIDSDTAVREVGSIFGLPQRFLKNEEEIEDQREARAQAQAQAQQQEQQAQQADVISKLSQAQAQGG
jgi:hypothetical protein